jgi:Uma2 family endonuclease
MGSATAPGIRFTVAEYLRMSDAGVFGSRRTELIAGRIIKMAPQLDPHMWAISRIGRLLFAATSRKDWLIIEGTLYLSKDSAPEPDFSLYNVPEGTPQKKRPLPILVVEVSNKTYNRDSRAKLRIYAKAGIQDYWIVNLRDRRIEVYRKPENPIGTEKGWRYASVTHLLPGQKVAMLARPSVSFPVRELLPDFD